MRKFSTSLLVSFLAATSGVYAQTSVLQDKSGETSVLVKDQPVIINAGDANVTVNTGYGWARTAAKSDKFIGINLTVKSEEGVAALLEGYKFKPDYKASIYFALTPHDTAHPSTTHTVYLAPYVGKSYFNLLQSDTTNTFDKRNFGNAGVKLGYNLLTALGNNSIILGVSADVGQLNNLSALKEAEVYQTVTANQTTRLTDKEIAYAGSYTTFTGARFNFDAYVFPKLMGGLIGLGGYSRTLTGGPAPKTNAGLGFIVGQKGAPSHIAVGVFYQFKDIFDQTTSDKKLLERSGINVVAGYKL